MHNEEVFHSADSIEKAFDALAPEVKARLKSFNFEKEVTLIPPVEGEARTGTFVPSRNFSDDLCYGVGFSYMGGLTAGTLWGAWYGLRMPLPTNSLSVRYTMILNQITSKGPFIANRFATLVTIYNVSRALLAESGLNNNFSTIGGAATSGFIFRISSGIRSAATTSATTSVIGLGWLFLNRLNKKD